MYFDPTLVMWILLAAASGCAFMLGKFFGGGVKEEIINDTILYLIDNNYVKAEKVDGEWEILELEQN
jgi:hypothetical protein